MGEHQEDESSHGEGYCPNQPRHPVFNLGSCVKAHSYHSLCGCYHPHGQFAHADLQFQVFEEEDVDDTTLLQAIDGTVGKQVSDSIVCLSGGVDAEKDEEEDGETP